MSSLSSSSTNQEVWDAYDDNASYAEDNSVAKAKVFITACRILLRRTPKFARQSNRHEVETDPSQLRRELEQATAWLQSNPDFTAGGGVIHPTINSDFRG